MLIPVETERVSPANLVKGDKIEIDSEPGFVVSVEVTSGHIELTWEVEGANVWEVYCPATDELITRVLVDGQLTERPGSHI